VVGVCACPEIDAFARAGLLFDEELDIVGTAVDDGIVAIPDAAKRQLEVKIDGMHVH
jgi:hypothetical protein